MAEEIIEIVGDLVTLKTVETVRHIKLEQLMPHLVQKTPVTIPVLPRTARFVHYDDTQPNKRVLYVLAELPPAVRTITKANKGSGNKRKYSLAFPWTYFWFVAINEGMSKHYTIQQYKCFHSKEQFTGEKWPGEFYRAFCPNLSDDGTICFGSTGGPLTSIDQQIDYIVNSWYLTEFNDHLDGGFPWPFGGRNFKNWVEQTAVNGPNVWRDIPEWSKVAKYSIENLLGAGIARATTIMSDIVIPEIPAPMTFGRASEWLAGLTSQNRGRLKIALANMAEDQPDTIEIPADLIMGAVEVLDDGGIAV